MYPGLMLAAHLTSVLAVSLALVSCSGNTGGAVADAGSVAADGAAVCSPATGANPEWLLSTQESDLRKLTGVEPTTGGVTLFERSTAAHRTATRTFLQSRFASLGYSAMLDDYGTGKNVFAELPATFHTTDTIVVGAHFDTVPDSPGANDNATGVSMVLAAARFAAELGCRSQNILFVLFDEEELGLIGSDKFAQLLGRGDFDVNVTAVHTIDQNGWDEDGDRAFELERPDGGLFAAYTRALQLAGGSLPIHETDTGFTDHVSFRNYGFTSIGVTEEYVNGDTTPHYHLSSDSYETVDREYLASTTRIMLTMLHSSVEVNSAARRAPSSPRAYKSLGDRYRAATLRPRETSIAPPSGCRAARSAQ